MAAATNPLSGGALAAQLLDRLRPLQPILFGFNHRNKSQHRGAQWWASFGMLRRHLDKFIEELDRASSSSASGKKRKRSKDQNRCDAVGGRKDDGPAETRARWLKDVLVPGCYT
jgi:ribonuclease MRP protein subunit RMP1